VQLDAGGPEPKPASADGYQVFEALYPKLRRFAAVVADLDTDPDDLVQDALAATLQRLELADLGAPSAYLKQAILNASANHRRRRAIHRRRLPRLARPAATTDHYPSDLSMLDVLDPIDRAVVFLADVERLPHAVIALELGLTPGAVRKRVSRSRGTLRRSLRPHVTPIPEERP
jgi:RNA polymerase sigma-70 factor (ECF subfamily)